MAINYDGNKPATGSPPVSGDMRDNFEAIKKSLANRHNWSNTDETQCTHKQFSEANIVPTSAIIDSAVSNVKLKRGTGSAIGQNLSSGVDITMHEYTFSSNIATSNTVALVSPYATEDPNSYVGKFRLDAVPGNYWVRWRYLTASDNPFILVLKKDTEIIGVWEAEDPPENLLGLTMDKIKKLDKRELPIFDPTATGVEVFYPCPRSLFDKIKEDSKKFKKNFFELIKEGNY